MDLYSAESHVKKLLKYVEDLAGKQSKVYSKSRTRLRDVADTCNKVVEIISSILQEEALAEDEVEFGSDSNIVAVLDEMQDKISQIRRFAGAEEGQVIEQPVQNTLPSASFSNDRRKAMRAYKDCLMKLSLVDFNYEPAGRCAKILWTWFDTRFLKTVQGTGFKYNMKRFAPWIRNFVIVYGKCIRDGTSLAFEDSFQRWIESIITTDAKNKYAVPYEIYDLDRTIPPQDLSLEAVVIWDMLLDYGLSDICTSQKDDLYLDEYSMYDLCSELSPEILDDYTDYKAHPELVEKLGRRN